MKIVKYSRQYENLTSTFNSGNEVLDSFIKSDEAFDTSHGVTYIALNETADEIIGYYNIASGTFDFIESGIRTKQCGAAHINYFAVTASYQNRIQYSDGRYNYKLSDIILLDCINRIEEIRENIGIGCITLSSTKQGYNLYCRADFEDMEEDFCFTNTDQEHKTIDMYYMFDYE